MYPDILGTKCKKKYSISSLQKKYAHSSRHTWNEKEGKLFLNFYYLTVKVKKNNDKYTFLMLNYV